jgi:hypothetical protein
MVGGGVVLLALVVASGVVAALASSTGNHDLAGGAIVVALVAVKIPLLIFLWWLFGKHIKRGPQPWEREERGEILAYLQSEAERVRGLPDAPARLAFLSREAWNVVDQTPDGERADAITVALRIQSMAARPGVRRPPVA